MVGGRARHRLPGCRRSLGYAMLWKAIATFPLMAAVQLICAAVIFFLSLLR